MLASLDALDKGVAPPRAEPQKPIVQQHIIKKPMTNLDILTLPA
jgi:hypothetical protein